MVNFINFLTNVRVHKIVFYIVEDSATTLLNYASNSFYNAYMKWQIFYFVQSADCTRYIGVADTIYLRHDMFHTICSASGTCFTLVKKSSTF